MPGSYGSHYGGLSNFEGEPTTQIPSATTDITGDRASTVNSINGFINHHRTSTTPQSQEEIDSQLKSDKEELYKWVLFYLRLCFVSNFTFVDAIETI